MPKVKQFTTVLLNKSGKLHDLCSTLSKAGINILGMLVPDVPRGKRGKVRFLVDDESKAEEALKAAKVHFSEDEVLVLTLDNQPGKLAEIVEKLAQEKVSVKYAYAATEKDAQTASIILGVSDLDKALSSYQAGEAPVSQATQ